MAPIPKLRDALAAAATQLESRTDAERLLMHALDVDRAWLFAHGLEPLAPDAAARFAALVERRARGEPVAYITGRQGFWNLDLEVSPATLIPRPETELLVELALERLPEDAPCTVADLGTGSGAIALALARERPLARVLASDLSAEALAVARANAVHAELQNIEFVQGDWFGPLAGRRFDLIVSNPPYIESGDPHLAQGDLRFEPRQALASGVDGLDAIRVLVARSHEHLQADGWLLFEHGWRQGEAARNLLQSSSFSGVFTARDLEDRERVTGAGSPRPDPQGPRPSKIASGHV